jgi:hypothetical protein
MAGTSGATFIGLLFVVVTLGTGWSTSRARAGVDAFLTPTLVHFFGVLLISMTLLVPWPTAWPISSILGLCALAGLAYQIRTIPLKHRQDLAALAWHDWIPHAIVPALGNVSLFAGAVGLAADKPFAPYAIAGAVTLILVAGIYGAWDITLWIVRNRDQK